MAAVPLPGLELMRARTIVQWTIGRGERPARDGRAGVQRSFRLSAMDGDDAGGGRVIAGARKGRAWENTRLLGEGESSRLAALMLTMEHELETDSDPH